ncbi:MAG: TolB family protein [Gemmatimonadaceae bacterium]
MRRHCLLVAATLVALSCGDSSGPSGGRPGLTLVSGYDVTDTVGAKPVKALVVEVRDQRGAIVPRGTVVRFTPAMSSFSPEMLVEALTSPYYEIFTTGETDAAGRAGVLVQLGNFAGAARIAISVPTFGLQDTARFTVLPGRPAAILMLPSDTAMYTTGSYAIRGGVVDRFNNPRNDPVVYASSSPGVSVSSSGMVTASALGRYTLTGTLGALSGSSSLSIVPQGTLAALVYRTNGLRIVTFNLDGSGFHDLVGVIDGGIGPHPQWLPASSTIIYTELVNGLQQLRTVDASGKVSTFFSNPPATMTHQAEPSPSANAPVLYFSAYDSRCSYYAYCLFRSGIDGTSPELLGDIIAPGEAIGHPSPSPDGSKVAFVASGPQIKVFDYTTKTVSAWSVTGNYPAWSPDGTQIAYAEQYGGSLHLMNADGTNQRVITGSRPYAEVTPVWSPDSKWVIAQNTSYGVLDIIEVATGNILPVINGAGYGSLSWK